MSRTYVDIEAVKEVLSDVKDCEDKQYALALLEWAIDKRTVSEEEIRADERAKVLDKIIDFSYESKTGFLTVRKGALIDLKENENV